MWEGKLFEQAYRDIVFGEILTSETKRKRQMNCLLPVLNVLLLSSLLGVGGWGWKLPQTSMYQLCWKPPCSVVNVTEAVTWLQEPNTAGMWLPSSRAQNNAGRQRGGLIATESSGKADVEMELGVHEVY